MPDMCEHLAPSSQGNGCVHICRAAQKKMHFSGNSQKGNEVGVYFDVMYQELELLCEMKNGGQG